MYRYIKSENDFDSKAFVEKQMKKNRMKKLTEKTVRDSFTDEEWDEIERQKKSDEKEAREYYKDPRNSVFIRH